MHRSYKFTTPDTTRRLPPFGAVGWFMTIQSGPEHRREERFGLGEATDRSPCVGAEPTRRARQAWQWKPRFAAALDWLRRVPGLPMRKA